jgi:serine/threonine-protein kinase
MAKPAASENLSDQPESVGRYQVVAPLGRGAMGMVYRARDTVLDREVAVKIMAGGLQQDAAFRTRFEREARIVARINHPNVVVVYDLGSHTDGSPFIAMELLSGQDLATVLRTRPLDVDDSAAIALQVLAGLARAHQREVVHRDVKPANIFITDDGKVKVMDFGVARLTASAVTATGAVLGTAYYMSPEQVRGGRVDGRSDVFSVGCVLFEMLASKRPFEAEDMLGILYQIANAEPDFSLVSPAGQALVPILRRALQKDPASRYPSAPHFARDLRRYLRESASSPWARHAAEIVELEPDSGSGPVRAKKPDPDVDLPTEVTTAGSTVSPLGHLVGADPTAVADGPPASLSPAPPDERPSHEARLPVGTIGAGATIVVAALAGVWWWQMQPPATSPDRPPGAPPTTVASAPPTSAPESETTTDPAPPTLVPESDAVPDPMRPAAPTKASVPGSGPPRVEPPRVREPVPPAPRAVAAAAARPLEPPAAPTEAAPAASMPAPSEMPGPPPAPAAAGAAPEVLTPTTPEARPEPAVQTAPAAPEPRAAAPPAPAPPPSASAISAPPARAAETTTPSAPRSPLITGATRGRRFDGRMLAPIVRLDFEMRPDVPSPGGRSAVVVRLVNDGNATVRVRQIVVTTVSGDDRKTQTVPGRAEAPPGQQMMLLRRTVSWPSEPPWSMEVVVHTRAGETYTNTVGWQ